MNKRHVSIFLSSTFRDMQAERDHIKKRVLPRLREALDAHGVTIHITDLRWGVDTAGEDEADRETKVLKVCLDAIHRDRPYFIGLVGQRYGWIPEAERMRRMTASLSPAEKKLVDESSATSVTELEMLLGAIGSAEMLPHSFFFFRNKAGYDSIPTAHRPTYCDTDPALTAKIDRLRTRIANAFAANGMEHHIHSYDFSWDHERGQVSGLDAFGEQVYNAVFNDIMADVKIASGLSAFESERRSLQNFIAGKLENFSGRHGLVESLVARLLEFDPLNPAEHHGCFLIGDSGSGKSAVLSRVYELLEENARQDSRIILLAHAAGITKDSAKPMNMIARWNSELSQAMGITDAPPADTDGFSRLMWLAAAQGFRPIILIDSYDSFDMPANDYYEWDRTLLDLSFIPGNIPFICTTVPGKVEQYVERRSSYTSISLDRFTITEANELLDRTLASSSKELPADLRNLLLSLQCPDGSPAYSSPFWLSMAVSLLDELGDNDFQNIDKEQQSRDDLKINAYLQRIISTLPTDVEKLFERFIELSAQYFPERITKTAMVFSAIAETGIDERELEMLLSDEWDELQFACFARWFRRFFRRSPVNLRWQLTHDRLKRHLSARYANFVEDLGNRYTNVLIDRLETDDPQTLEELMFQTIKRNDINAFIRISSHIWDCSCDFPYDRIIHWIPERISAKHMRDFCIKLVTALMNGSTGLRETGLTGSFIANFMHDSFRSGLKPVQRADMLRNIIDCITEEQLLDGDPYKMDVFINLSYSFSQLYSDYPSKRADANFEHVLPIFKNVLERHGSKILVFSRTARNMFSLALEYAKLPWRRLISLPSDQRYPILDDPRQAHYREMKRRADILMDITHTILAHNDRERGFMVERLEQYAKDKMGTKFLYEDNVELDRQIAMIKAHVPAQKPVAEPENAYARTDITPDSPEQQPTTQATDTPASPLENAICGIKSFINSYVTFQPDTDYDQLTELAISVADLMAADGRQQQAAALVTRIGSLFTTHLANIQFAHNPRRQTDSFVLLSRDSIYYRYKLEPHVTAKAIAGWLTANGHGDTATAFASRINPYLGSFHKISPNRG